MNGRQMQLEDWLDDLCVRFIINLPQEDLSSVARICFQVEEAQWFYEDFIRPLDPSLPSLSLRTFCLRIFQHCPLLASFSVENHTKAFEEFLQYKTRIPVRGAIMLNHEMDSVVLVKGWKKGANWSFPRGKINKDEDDLDCAVREVYEETGLDLKAADLVPTENKPKYIEINMREQQLRLYVFRDVPMDTNFHPRTRKEISKIEWYKLSELPTFRKKTAQQNQDAAGNNKFYMVAPFLVPLKKWVASQKKQDDKKMAQGHYSILQAHTSVDEAVTEDDTWGAGREGARSQIPPIETLDGATQELQRLLKVQPPTQGLQPAPQHQDKASALLSILQAKSAPISNAPPPQHQPSLHSHPSDPAQFPPHMYHHGPPMHMQHPPHFQPPEHHNFPAPPPEVTPRHVTADPAQLLHPRPSAPQVQQSVYRASSAFQQQSLFQPQSQVHGQGPPSQQQQQQQQQLQQAPQQQHPLSGQSMALLNAFKRDTAKDSAARNSEFSQLIMGLQQTEGNQAPQVNAAPHFNGQLPVNQAPQFTGQPPQPQQQPQPQQKQQKQAAHQQNLMNLLRPAEASAPATAPAPPSMPSHPSELAGSSVRPGEDHRSALLGMFKGQGQAPAPPLPLQQRSVQDDAPTSIPINSLFISEKSSAAPSGPASQTQSPGLAQLQSHQQQSHGMYPASMTQGIPAANKPAPAPAPNSGQDPKKQLLSLFENAQRPPATDVVHEIAQGAPVDNMPNKTRVSSLASHGGTPATNDSRRGSETPISPADESFLLGYLQSLTKR